MKKLAGGRLEFKHENWWLGLERLQEAAEEEADSLDSEEVWLRGSQQP